MSGSWDALAAAIESATKSFDELYSSKVGLMARCSKSPSHGALGRVVMISQANGGQLGSIEAVSDKEGRRIVVLSRNQERDQLTFRTGGFADRNGKALNAEAASIHILEHFLFEEKAKEALAHLSRYGV